MATITHLFPGQIKLQNVPKLAVLPISALGVDTNGLLGKTDFVLPPDLNNGQIYVGNSTPGQIIGVTPTTNGGLTLVNTNTINLLSDGDTSTFNMKIDETSEPQLKGLKFNTTQLTTAASSPSVLVANQTNQFTQTLNYSITGNVVTTTPFTIYILATESNSVYLVQFEYDRFISGSDNSTNIQTYRIANNAGTITVSPISTSSNGAGTILGITANRTLSTSVSVANVSFTVRTLLSNNKLAGTVKVTKAL